VDDPPLRTKYKHSSEYVGMPHKDQNLRTFFLEIYVAQVARVMSVYKLLTHMPATCQAFAASTR
jgi:hypothetical protein